MVARLFGVSVPIRNTVCGRICPSFDFHPITQSRRQAQCLIFISTSTYKSRTGETPSYLSFAEPRGKPRGVPRGAQLFCGFLIDFAFLQEIIGREKRPVMADNWTGKTSPALCPIDCTLVAVEVSPVFGRQNSSAVARIPPIRIKLIPATKLFDALRYIVKKAFQIGD